MSDGIRDVLVSVFDGVTQIWSIERVSEHDEIFIQTQHADDVRGDALRCGGSETEYGDSRELLLHNTEVIVVGAEIMTPL